MLERIVGDVTRETSIVRYAAELSTHDGTSGRRSIGSLRRQLLARRKSTDSRSAAPLPSVRTALTFRAGRCFFEHTRSAKAGGSERSDPRSLFYEHGSGAQSRVRSLFERVRSMTLCGSDVQTRVRFFTSMALALRAAFDFSIRTSLGGQSLLGEDVLDA